MSPPRTGTPIVSVATLKALLTRIGSTTSGAKRQLLSQLSDDLKTSRIPRVRQKTRIMSIDMGIKNLAFCVADVHTKELRNQGKKKFQEQGIKMDIVDWRRLNLAEKKITEAVPPSLDAANPTNSTTLESSPPPAQKNKKKKPSNKKSQDNDTDLYSPSILSKTAHQLLTQTLLPYNPDVILIERQRWRSSGSPAIQQWTVRVNMLESMLWAILTTLRAEAEAEAHNRRTSSYPSSSVKDKDNHAFQVFDVVPQNVAKFCVPQQLGQVKRKAAGRLVDPVAGKKEKIERLRSWLMHDSPSTIGASRATALRQPTSNVDNDTNSNFTDLPLIPVIDFSFTSKAEPVRQVLCATLDSGAGRKERVSLKEAAGLIKLDDVTDCFLQAVAWVGWEKNRLQLLDCGWDIVIEDLLEPKEEDGKKLREGPINSMISSSDAGEEKRTRGRPKKTDHLMASKTAKEGKIQLSTEKPSTKKRAASRKIDNGSKEAHG